MSFQIKKHCGQLKLIAKVSHMLLDNTMCFCLNLKYISERLFLMLKHSSKLTSSWQGLFRLIIQLESAVKKDYINLD